MPVWVKKYLHETPVAGAPDPAALVEQAERLKILARVLPHLKPRDRRRLQAFLNAQGDFDAAALSLGMSYRKFRQQWRETVQLNIRRATRQLNLD